MLIGHYEPSLVLLSILVAIFASYTALSLALRRVLAERGRPEDRIPACLSCHEKAAGNPVYPRLSGQSRPYLQQQLELFAGGVRGGTRYSHLMTEAARKLEEEDIAAAAAYFSQRD